MRSFHEGLATTMPVADKITRREKPTTTGQYEPVWKQFLNIWAMVYTPPTLSFCARFSLGRCDLDHTPARIRDNQADAVTRRCWAAPQLLGFPVPVKQA